MEFKEDHSTYMNRVLDNHLKQQAKDIFKDLENHPDFKLKLGYAFHYDKIKNKYIKK